MNYFNKKVLLFVAAVSVVSLIVFTTMSSESEEPRGADNNSDTVLTLEKVESQYVCMVNNRLFPNEQIPVEVEGKTYYGCCEMCKGTLANHSESRMSEDPFTGSKVDKAQSVAAADPEGKIYYFENEKNLKEFNR